MNYIANYPYIFISFASEDISIAIKISTYLQKKGFKVFIDHHCIKSSDDWDEKIEIALQETDRLVLLLSKSSMPYKKEVKREWFYYDQEKKPIHPVLIENCNLQSRLIPYQYIDARDNLDNALDRLVNELTSSFDEVEKPTLSERIIFNENSDPSLEVATNNLEKAVISENFSIELSINQLNDIANKQHNNIKSYLLGKIAEYSLPRHQLDKKFVKLSLFVNKDSIESLNDVTGFSNNLIHHNLLDIALSIDIDSLVLLGKPGSGKSTLLKRLQLDLCRKGIINTREYVPILISLNQYQKETDSEALSPYDWLLQTWSERYPGLPSLERLIEKRNVFFLLDGLNEIPHTDQDEYRSHIKSWRNFLTKCVTNHPGNKFIFSCRNLDYSFPLSIQDHPVPHVRVEPLDDLQIQDFLNVYTPVLKSKVWNEIKDSKYLKIYRNPLFLMLLIAQSEKNRSTPKNQAQLFVSFFRKSISKEINKDNSILEINSGLLTKQDLLKITNDSWKTPYDLPCNGLFLKKISELAYLMQSTHYETGAKQVRLKKTEAVKSINHTNAEIILNAGIGLNILDEDFFNSEIYFHHQLFQEFFSGLFFSQNQPFDEIDNINDFIKITNKYNNSIPEISTHEPIPSLSITGWEETLIFAAMMADNHNEFIVKLAQKNLLLAGVCVANESITVSSLLKEKIIDDLFLIYKNEHYNIRLRIDVGLVIGMIGDPSLRKYSNSECEYILPPFVEIPSAKFSIGSDEGLFIMESPAHNVFVNTFHISLYPITNSEFSYFIDNGGYRVKKWWEFENIQWEETRDSYENYIKNKWASIRNVLISNHELPLNLFKQGRLTLQQAASILRVTNMEESEFLSMVDDWYSFGVQTEPRFWRDSVYNNPLKPVVGISWFEAKAYCNWLSEQSGLKIRLPTEYEWEAAAKGLENKIYSFGDIFNKNHCNTAECNLMQTTPIGLYSNHRSSLGCYDMSGNIFEWVDNLFQSYNLSEIEDKDSLNYVCRGGSWRHKRIRARIAYRGRGNALTRNDDLGFRICYSK